MKNKVSIKVTILPFLILICIGMTYYFHWIRGMEVVFAHFFYVPIAFAGFLWGRRGALVGILLGALLLASHFLSGLGTPYWGDFLRSVMFAVIGLTVGILRDQTLRTDKILWETQGYLANLLEYASAPVIVWDLAFRITCFNHAFEHLTGYKADEVIGKELYMIFPEASKGKSLNQIANTLSGEYWKSVEIPILCKDGSIQIALWNSANIYAKDSKTLLATIAQGVDITERKRIEKALRESEEKYRSLFEDSKDVVYISTIEGKFLDINSAGVELFGYDSKEELLKVDIVKDIYLNPHDRKKFIQPMQQQGFVKDYELLMKKKDGEILTLLLTTIPYRDKEGKITEYRGILRDVTQQKKLEQQLLQSQKMEAVGQLAGGIAHDFNNILQTIMGYASLLQMKMSKDDPFRGSIDEILTSVERAAKLTQGLLIFSRKQIANMILVNLNEIIKRVEKLLLRVIAADIELNTKLTDEDLTVMADSGQIEQVLMNLATNAKDAMPDGGNLTIETELVEIDDEYIKMHGYGEPGIYTLISVTDTGTGMDEKTREKIFEPFFTTKEVGKGTGLGLSIIYGIIKQHNGYINVYSELEKGTTLKIYLPVIKSEVEQTKPATVITAITGGTETVLLAEDDADVRRLTKVVLEEYGYKVIEAADGEDAIKRFSENKDKIQLVLLDAIMPKKSGKDVYKEIKKIKPDIKTLFMSGYTVDLLENKGIIEKELDFILKPVLPTVLLRKLREVLDK